MLDPTTVSSNGSDTSHRSDAPCFERRGISACRVHARAQVPIGDRGHHRMAPPGRDVDPPSPAVLRRAGGRGGGQRSRGAPRHRTSRDRLASACGSRTLPPRPSWPRAMPPSRRSGSPPKSSDGNNPSWVPVSESRQLARAGDSVTSRCHHLRPSAPAGHCGPAPGEPPRPRIPAPNRAGPRSRRSEPPSAAEADPESDSGGATGACAERSSPSAGCGTSG